MKYHYLIREEKGVARVHKPAPLPSFSDGMKEYEEKNKIAVACATGALYWVLITETQRIEGEQVQCS